MILSKFVINIIRDPRKNIFNPVFNLMSFVNTVRNSNKKYAEAAAQAGINLI